MITIDLATYWPCILGCGGVLLYIISFFVCRKIESGCPDKELTAFIRCIFWIATPISLPIIVLCRAFRDKE